MRAVVLLAVVALAARPAIACRCTPLGLRAAMKDAKHVFVARVVKETRQKVDSADCRAHPDWCSFTYAYTFAVEGTWKGDVPAEVVIDTGTNTGDCSMGRLRSDRYVIFAKGTPDALQLHMCGGTRGATKALLAEMTTAFGAPKAP